MSLFSKLFKSQKKSPIIGRSYLSRKQIIFKGGDLNNHSEEEEDVHLDFRESHVQIKFPRSGKIRSVRWKFEREENSSQVFIDEEHNQWILAKTHVTYTEMLSEITTVFVFGDPDNKSKIKIEESAIQGRVQLMQIMGMEISDQIQSYHFCPKCRKFSIGLTVVNDSTGNNLPIFAQKLRNNPHEVIGMERDCECGTPTTLIKLIYQRTSPRNNFDIHYYFQYGTEYSEYAVEIISVTPQGKLMRFSASDRERYLGF